MISLSATSSERFATSSIISTKYLRCTLVARPLSGFENIDFFNSVLILSALLSIFVTSKHFSIVIFLSTKKLLDPSISNEIQSEA